MKLHRKNRQEQNKRLNAPIDEHMNINSRNKSLTNVRTQTDERSGTYMILYDGNVVLTTQVLVSLLKLASFGLERTSGGHECWWYGFNSRHFLGSKICHLLKMAACNTRGHLSSSDLKEYSQCQDESLVYK